MYAIVLAGGYATRLWPLTKGTPKALLPIAGKPILDYIVDKLEALYPPLDTIILSTNTYFQMQFENWFILNPYPNLKIIPDKSSNESEKPGAIKAMANIINAFPEDDVLVLAGDGLFNDDLSGLLSTFNSKKQSVVAVYRVASLETAKRCATITADAEGQILDFIEKPTDPKSKLVCGAVYLFKKGVRKRLNEYLSNGLSTDQPGRFVEWLCRKESIYTYTLADSLWDIGTHQAYKECDDFFTQVIKIRNIGR